MTKDYIKPPVAVEGVPFIAMGLLVSLLLLALNGVGASTLVAAGLTVFTICFFRNPARTIPDLPDAVISPADGRIIVVKEVDEDRFLHARVLKVSIFMSVFNVHVNRIPFSGQVAGIFYNKGRFISAFKEKASLDNEQNAILIESDSGAKILFIQIAGLIARRIVCYLDEAERVKKGDRFGLIRFGSRVDLYLPLNSTAKVKVGDNVSAGSTIIASLGSVPD